jgi:peptidoglycan hydrolase-like protein with peptidoglycan-binding domain
MQFILPTISEAQQIPPGPHMSVTCLQRALLRAGFNPGRIDGGFLPGSQTAVATRQFQAANGIVANGTVGPDTWQALPDEDMNGLPTLQAGMEGGAVAMLQRMLHQMGFNPMFPDVDWNGVFGKETDAAVRAYQATDPSGTVVVDGIVGEQTWSLMT